MAPLGQSETWWWVRKGQDCKNAQKTSGKMEISIILFRSDSFTSVHMHQISYSKHALFGYFDYTLLKAGGTKERKI